jgi:5,10-methylenetetrahydromethanopterin reductase
VVNALRTSVNLMPEASVAEIVDLAVLAERLGYDRCWVYDEGLATRDVYVTMTAIAGATRRIEVGPGITNAYTRHPATTAAAMASLDEFSGGRAFVGIGAGGSLTLGPLGIDRSKPLGAVRDLIGMVRGLFSGEPITFDSAIGSLAGATLGYARPGLPIWLAGRGPKMLALGGELADGVMLDFLHEEAIGAALDLVRSGAARTGNKPGLCYSTLVVTDDDSLDMVRPHMTYRLVDSQPDVRARIGMTDDDREAIRSAMSGGLEAAGRLVKDEWVLPFVISGSTAACAKQIRALHDDHGIEEFMVPVLDVHNAADYMTRVAAVLDEVRS